MTERAAPRTAGPWSAEDTLFDRSRRGRPGVPIDFPDVPEADPAALWGADQVREDIEHFPELSELEVVRHFTRISQYNLGIDTATYPLGSCTMKYNPRLNEAAAALPGFSRLHPLADPELAQGMLGLAHELELALAEISGLHRVSLQPAAGAQGELVGLKLIDAYHRSRGEHQRRTVLIPDTAHGTNPASAALCGLGVRAIPSGEDGIVHPEALEPLLGDDSCALMLTNPNTLGFFEQHVERLCELVHEAGGLVYLDGANMNALLGVAKPGHMGVDVMHFNLHKTFSTPHGGGGPGSGPVAVHEKLEPFLPRPVLCAEGGRYRLDDDRPQSIGRVHGFFGNAGMWIRALAYIRTLGASGLHDVTAHAVLNANYILASLRDRYEVPREGRVMHECVLSDRRQQRTGVTTADIAKRMMDYGFHPPTIYFPLVVAGALMIEPTECEPLSALDALIGALRAIADEAEEDPSQVTEAPHTTVVRRVDEVQAARRPRLRWTPPEPT